MIPLVDVNREHKFLEEEIKQALSRVVGKGDFILGEDVSLFEKEFSCYCETKFAVGVSSGTEALCLSLKALGIGKGDKVITAANTFIATALAVTFVGAAPVLIDADPLTYNIDPDKIRKFLCSRHSKNTRAIIPVHLYGHPADMKAILKIAQEYNLKIVEDACQAHGAYYESKRVGGFGAAGCFSFYPAKNLGALGDAGIVVTNKKSIARKICMFRNYGQIKKYHHLIKGSNNRLDTIQAAVLRVKLKYLDKNNQMRRSHAQLYSELLKDSGYILPVEKSDCAHVYHLYVVRVRKRRQLQDYLSQQGISTGIHYPIPIHLSKAYVSLGYKRGDFPITEELSAQIVSLPMFPYLKREEIEQIADCLRRF